MTKAVLSLIVLLLPAQAFADTEDHAVVEEPWTYKECIKRASDINSKWIEYKADVNKCRAEFDVPGEY